MKIMLDKGAKMPTRAHTWDAGLDLYTPMDVMIPACAAYASDFVCVGSETIDTGVHIAIPEGYAGFIKSKSGLNVNYGLTAEGVIDAHYTGSIRVKIYNHTANPYLFQAGDKIAQLVILPVAITDLEQVDSLEETDRGDCGFGSTGR